MSKIAYNVIGMQCKEFTEEIKLKYSIPKVGSK